MPRVALLLLGTTLCLSAQNPRFGVEVSALSGLGWGGALRMPGAGVGLCGEYVFAGRHGVRLRAEVGRFQEKETLHQIVQPGASLTQAGHCSARGSEVVVEYVRHLRADPLGWEWSTGLGVKNWRSEASFMRHESVVTGGGATSHELTYAEEGYLGGLAVTFGAAYGWSERWAVTLRLSMGLGMNGGCSSSAPPLSGLPAPREPWEGKSEMSTLALGLRARF